MNGRQLCAGLGKQQKEPLVGSGIKGRRRAGRIKLLSAELPTGGCWVLVKRQNTRRRLGTLWRHQSDSSCGIFGYIKQDDNYCKPSPICREPQSVRVGAWLLQLLGVRLPLNKRPVQLSCAKRVTHRPRVLLCLNSGWPVSRCNYFLCPATKKVSMQSSCNSDFS